MKLTGLNIRRICDDCRVVRRKGVVMVVHHGERSCARKS